MLQELIDDDSVTEIMVNGTEGIFVERAGQLFDGGKNLPHRKSWKIFLSRSLGSAIVL